MRGDATAFPKSVHLGTKKEVMSQRSPMIVTEKEIIHLREKISQMRSYYQNALSDVSPLYEFIKDPE